MIRENINDFFNDAGRFGPLLGIDLGDRRVGLSISDRTQSIASNYSTLQKKKFSVFSLDLKSIIDKEQKLITEELKNSGKPEEIAKKISLGEMNKFKEENALLTQAWVMEPKKKVQDVLKELAINDLKIKEFSRIKIGE